MEQFLFVTGMLRSGTTLLDRLLSLHPRVQVLSQPLPLLFVEIKRTFLEQRGSEASLDPIRARYPLNDMFGSHYYPPAELESYLRRYQPTLGFCDWILQEMTSFSGQYTRPRDPTRLLEDCEFSSLGDFLRSYAGALIREEGHPPCSVTGIKETSCEEFIPYLLATGAKVVQILRDPRDVITSLNHGGGAQYGGRRKPLLFNVRQWRKSAALLLAHQQHPGYCGVIYERLVGASSSEIARLSEFLQQENLPPELFEGDLRSRSTAVWHSNSSHIPSSRITSRSVGRYREYLSSATDHFIQALCYPELRRLGYDLDVDAAAVESVMGNYSDTDALERSELRDYIWSEALYREERRRWRLFRSGEFVPEYFLFEAAFDRLRETAAVVLGDDATAQQE